MAVFFLLLAAAGLGRGTNSPVDIPPPIDGPASLGDAELTPVDRYITETMSAARIPGVSVAIVKGDQAVYLKSYGEADRSGRAVTPQTSFIIGSITKAFTAVAVMQLVESGKVELDAPVQRYIGWFRVADPQFSAGITVRQLLNQTSGLPMIRKAQDWTDQDPGVLERVVGLLATEQLDFPPGQSYGYSNANYETIGLIVEKVSGQTYEDYVAQHIFAPLEMQNSFVSQDEAQKHGMASGNRWWFGFPFPYDPPYNRAEAPAGYIISSAEDMSHFLIAEMNEGRYQGVSMLSPESIALTQTEPVPNTYAMGWVNTNINGHKLIGHDGGTTNFQCSVFFDPEAKVGVFVAANVMVGLDAFSSPRGSDPLDGTTTRAMALSVLNIAMSRPLPDQGRGIKRSYMVFNLVIMLLSTFCVVSIVIIPWQRRRLLRIGIRDRSALAWRIGLAALVHLILPLLLLLFVLKVPDWRVYVSYQPDLAYWLAVVACVIFVRGVVKMFLIWQVFEQAAIASSN